MADEDDPRVARHRRENWRRGWIDKFRERQRVARNWIEFLEIAKWCAHSTTGASADAEQQALVLGYQRLAASVLHGEFEVRGRSEILYLDPTVMTDGMAPRWRLSCAAFEVVAKIFDSSLPMPVLARCWLKRDRAAAWLRLHGYPLPPSSRAHARRSDGPAAWAPAYAGQCSVTGCARKGSPTGCALIPTGISSGWWPRSDALRPRTRVLNPR
jgi:hypothetical protein